MNTYDYDMTISSPDSGVAFFAFCIKRYPRIIIPLLPKLIGAAVKFFRGRSDAYELKECIYSFLPKLPDVDKTIEDFCKEFHTHVAPWYLQQKRDDDVIISASPEFIIAPLCEYLGVRCLATQIDRYTGKFYGTNCHDKEKLVRFMAAFPGEKTECFYSDSLADTPMAEFAEKAYIVRKGFRLEPWPGKQR